MCGCYIVGMCIVLKIENISNANEIIFAKKIVTICEFIGKIALGYNGLLNFHDFLKCEWFYAI